MFSTYYPTNEEWDLFVESQQNNHILQLSAFGDLKKIFGWGVIRMVLVDKNGKFVVGAQILEQHSKIDNGLMAYIPMGPISENYKNWGDFFKIFGDNFSNKYALIKWEPGIFLDEIPDFGGFGFEPSNIYIQPPRTILIDVNNQDEVILSRMNQGTRRKIKICLNSGVQIYEGNESDLESFCQLMDVTANRKKFHGRDHDYYKYAYNLFKLRNHVSLLLAKHEKDVLAGIMLFTLGKTSYYLYGASSNIKRNLMAPYGIHWHAIKLSREKKCKYYDMWGIPDQPIDILEKEFQLRSDGLWGVYGFKRGFGGNIVRSVGAFDKKIIIKE